MDNTNLLLTLLGSGFVSAIVAGVIGLLNNRHIKKVEFDYDYKKYMLEKRKAAYDIIEKFFDYHQHAIDINDFKDEEQTDLVLKAGLIEQCLNFEIEINKHKIWISDDLQGELFKHFKLLKEYLHDIQSALDLNPDEHNVTKTYEQLHVISMQASLFILPIIYDSYMGDLMTLDKIEKFRKERLMSVSKLKKMKRKHEKEPV